MKGGSKFDKRVRNRENRGRRSHAQRSTRGKRKIPPLWQKLHGSFTLVRIRGTGEKASWLLIKHGDEYSKKGYDANTYDFSAVSNRSLAEIARSTPIS